MCEICKHFPCLSGCPNATLSKVYICEKCHEPIVENEDCYEMGNEYFHENCFEDYALEILINRCGAFKTVVNTEDEEW